MSELQEHFSKMTDEEFIFSIEQAVSKVRTKYCEKILKLLDKEGNLHHGDMAVRLELSPSGLNAIIRKMLEAEIFLKVDEIGKYKIYSLSDELKKYFRLKQGPAKHIPEYKNRKGLFLPLQHFAECAGKDWMDALNLCLTGEDADETDEVRNAFNVFIEQAENLDENDMKKIEKVLDNDILIRVLRMYLKELT